MVICFHYALGFLYQRQHFSFFVLIFCLHRPSVHSYEKHLYEYLPLFNNNEKKKKKNKKNATRMQCIEPLTLRHLYVIADIITFNIQWMVRQHFVDVDVDDTDFGCCNIVLETFSLHDFSFTKICTTQQPYSLYYVRWQRVYAVRTLYLFLRDNAI